MGVPISNGGLWLDTEDIGRLRSSLGEGHPHVTGLLAAARRIADLPLEEELLEELDEHGQRASRHQDDYWSACAVVFLLTGKPEYASKAAQAMLHAVEKWSPSDLRIGNWGMGGAVLWECCHRGWDPETREKMRALLSRLARSINQSRKGNPHNPVNNWWIVTHCGAYLAGLAYLAGCLEKDPANEPDPEVVEVVERSRGRILPFLHHFGNLGLYHEGTGYQGYVLSYLLPTLVAIEKTGTAAPFDSFPELRRMALPYFMMASEKSIVEDQADAPVRGIGTLSWNDSGASFLNSGGLGLMMHLAPAEFKGALRHSFDRYYGSEGDGSYAPGLFGYFFNLVFYPLDVEAEEPEGILPKHLVDTKQGMVLIRHGYAKGQDSIIGLYARPYVPGGHSQDDGGSLRIASMGHDWAIGGGQARGNAEWQTKVVRENYKPPRSGFGQIIWNEGQDSGAVVGMDLRKVSMAYHERFVSVDFSGRAGVPVLLAILDQVEDHLKEGWLWNQTYSRGLAFACHADGLGFTLSAPDGSRMDTRFLGSPPESIRSMEMPESRRSYSSGDTVTYRGRPFVQARFAPTSRFGIFCISTIARTAPPQVERTEGLSVRLGDFAWQRPFGFAIPPAYEPGVSGSLCRHPSGRDDYKL